MNGSIQRVRQISLALLLVAAGAVQGVAQQADTLKLVVPDTTVQRAQAAMDSAFARARQLVMSGQTSRGRQIADSIVAATPPNTPAYGDALYGRATLEPTAAAAERDYQQVVVEYPLSAHAGDALLELAQMERSQGNRAAAIQHLQHFLRDNPTSPRRAQTGLWLAQLEFEENDDIQACAILDTAHAAIAPGDVELQNQMNFYSPRCEAALARARADSIARADSLHADSVARADSVHRAEERRQAEARARAARARASATRIRYSVQIGAFNTRDQAEHLISRLHSRGIVARVDGSRAPFRVRIGLYTTHGEAAKRLAELKQAGINGFVTSIRER